MKLSLIKTGNDRRYGLNPAATGNGLFICALFDGERNTVLSPSGVEYGNQASTE